MILKIPTKTSFEPGCCYVTAQAIATFENKVLLDALERHLKCDWGGLCEEDSRQNDLALESGIGRLFSRYQLGENLLWIITEHDRSATTLLLPSDY